MKRVTFALSGMSCGHCVDSVTKALQSIDGVQVEKVGINEATVNIDPDRTSTDLVARKLDDIGYPVVSRTAA